MRASHSEAFFRQGRTRGMNDSILTLLRHGETLITRDKPRERLAFPMIFDDDVMITPI